MEKENINASTVLDNAEKQMQDWYENDFAKYKQKKQQEKLDFQEFAKIIVNNTTEIKHMLANIYDAKFETAVETWNALNLNPKAKQIKLEDEMLIVIDENNNELKVNFDKLLADIVKILGA